LLFLLPTAYKHLQTQCFSHCPHFSAYHTYLQPFLCVTMTGRHTGSPKSAWYILFSSLTLVHSVSQEELMGADLLVCKFLLSLYRPGLSTHSSLCLLSALCSFCAWITLQH
jgi:hypothetical protein